MTLFKITIPREIVLKIKKFRAAFVSAFILCLVTKLAVASDDSSTTLKSGATWVEADNGTPMNIDEFNQHTDSRKISTFCSKGECDTLPRLIKGNAPEYPPKLLRAEVTGQVIVMFTIDVSGKVVRPEVKSATRPEFATSVITAVSDWEFSPATLHGKPVEIRVEQIFPFELR